MPKKVSKAIWLLPIVSIVAVSFIVGTLDVPEFNHLEPDSSDILGSEGFSQAAGVSAMLTVFLRAFCISAIVWFLIVVILAILFRTECKFWVVAINMIVSLVVTGVLYMIAMKVVVVLCT